MTYDPNKAARVKDLVTLGEDIKTFIESAIPSETWTFELEDGTTVTREVSSWTSGT